MVGKVPGPFAAVWLRRVSPLALMLGIALSVAGCASKTDMQSTLCTNGTGEAPEASCEGPLRHMSLTMPRADLLKKVEMPAAEAPETTGSVTTQVSTGPEQTDPARVTSGSGMPPAAPQAAPALPVEPQQPPVFDAARVTGSVDKTEPPAPEADARKAESGDDAPKARREKTSSAPSRAVGDGIGRPGEARFSGGLTDAARKAIADHPLISLANARVREALAGIGVAESGLYPQLEGRVGGGPGLSGSYQDSSVRGYWADKNAAGSVRGEASLSGRQLLFDFGALRSDIQKTSAQHDSETLKLQEQIEAVAGQVVDIYLKILEQRELLTAATENVASLEKIVKLVEENEKNGNGTVADIKRVRSRLIDGQTAVADARSELQTGSDRFARLVHAVPGTLQTVYRSGGIIPQRPAEVINLLSKSNPRLLALTASLRAASHEIDAQKASAMPKLGFESDLSFKQYRTLKDKSELDAKGLVVLKYKFLDGGQHSNQLEQLNARYLQAEMRMRSEADDLEADVRKQYRVLDSARAKAASLKDNVATALKARQLYDEQFRGGKRTLLELLDIQTTYYTTRRTEITNKFEEQRAIHQVLLALGRLTAVILSGESRPAARSVSRKAVRSRG